MKATTAGWILFAICVFSYVNPLKLLEESVGHIPLHLASSAQETTAYKGSVQLVRKALNLKQVPQQKPAKIQTITIAGRALYLKGSTESNTVGKESSVERTTSTGSSLKLHSNMSWGADVELRYGRQGMDVDVGVDWIHINSKWTQGPTLSAFIAPTLADYDYNTTVSSLASASRIALNTLDVNVGKNYLNHKRIKLKTFFGLTGMTVRQHFHQTVYGPTIFLPTSSTSFSSMDSIGLSTAVSLEYLLGGGISLVGKTKGGAFASYLYSQVANYSIINPSEVDTSFVVRKHFISGFFSQILGMEWSSRFNKDKSKVSIGAGWDLMVFTSAWNIGGGSTLERDYLGFQGLCLDATFQF